MVTVLDHASQQLDGRHAGQYLTSESTVVRVTKSRPYWQLRALSGPNPHSIKPTSTQSFKAATSSRRPRRVAHRLGDGRATPGRVRDGRGINDNGSGVARVLETAVQLGNSPHVHNAGPGPASGAQRNSA